MARRTWIAFARAALRRALAQVDRVLNREPGDAHDVELMGARSLVRSAGELKGGVAKIAQMMAYLEGPDATSDGAARATLGALLDRAPTVDVSSVRRVIAEDLGAPPEELFAAWDDVPIAAASLGQVHAATALDGTALAVKVQYPGVAEALREDLSSRSLLRKLAGAGLGGRLEPDALEVLRQSVLGELDYTVEARWLERFGAAWSGDASVVIPRVFAAQSSSRVLVMERLAGRSPATLAADGSDGERAAAALAILRFALGSPLRHGLLNADPNPGNYLFLDGPTSADVRPGAQAGVGRVGFLDFGCALVLDEQLVENDRRLWRAVLKGDGETMRHAVAQQRLLGSALTLDRASFRDWERLLTAPFIVEGPFCFPPELARDLSLCMSSLLRDGGLRLPPAALLLWRQRLGALSVISSLRATADFRGALRSILVGVPGASGPLLYS